MTVTPEMDQRVARLIDANLDRAREGLRVIEDWCRFGLERKDLVIAIKDWRHRLGFHHHQFYKESRSTLSDKGALLNHPEQKNRSLTSQIIAANFSRVAEALRVIEEFSRNIDEDLAKASAEIRYGVYELETILIKIQIKKKRLKILNSCNIYLIATTQKELTKKVTEALKAGIRIVQYRAKGKSDKENLAQAKDLALICKKHGALLIINDRPDIALAIDADGVHLGQDDLPIEIARKILGSERIIGKSTHSLIQIKKAQEEGFDYIGIGPIFKTKTKPELEPIEPINFEEAFQKNSLPCFAIGGIDLSNLSSVKLIGLKKIAIANAIMNSESPYLTSKKLLENLK